MAKNKIKNIFKGRLNTAMKRRYIILWAVFVFFFVFIYQFVKVKDVDFNKLETNINQIIDVKKYKIDKPIEENEQLEVVSIKKDSDKAESTVSADTKVEETKKEEQNDGKILKKLYSIDKLNLDDFLLYAPTSNMQASEILILKVKPGYMGSIKTNVQKRVDAQTNSFKNYDKEQYNIIKEYELKVKGDYLFLIITKENSKIEDAISRSYK